MTDRRKAKPHWTDLHLALIYARRANDKRYLRWLIRKAQGNSQLEIWV